jgi:hypothetical protein
LEAGNDNEGWIQVVGPPQGYVSYPLLILHCSFPWAYYLLEVRLQTHIMPGLR